MPLLTCFGFVTRQKWLIFRRINLRKALVLIDVGVDGGDGVAALGIARGEALPETDLYFALSVGTGGALPGLFQAMLHLYFALSVGTALYPYAIALGGW